MPLVIGLGIQYLFGMYAFPVVKTDVAVLFFVLDVEMFL